MGDKIELKQQLLQYKTMLELEKVSINKRKASIEIKKKRIAYCDFIINSINDKVFVSGMIVYLYFIFNGKFLDAFKTIFYSNIAIPAILNAVKRKLKDEYELKKTEYEAEDCSFDTIALFNEKFNYIFLKYDSVNIEVIEEFIESVKTVISDLKKEDNKETIVLKIKNNVKTLKKFFKACNNS